MSREQGLKVKLVFGLHRSVSLPVSETEFQDFVDTVITLRFHNLSVYKLVGQ
jgi:hypothetical protein